MPGATLTNTSGGNLLVGVGGGNAICAFSLAQTCDDDLRIDFTGGATGLSFEVGGAQAGDLVLLTVLGPGGDAAGGREIAEDGRVDLSGFGTVTALLFEDRSTELGVSYGDVTFEPAAIPLPAGIALLLGGLGALRVQRRCDGCQKVSRRSTSAMAP